MDKYLKMSDFFSGDVSDSIGHVAASYGLGVEQVIFMGKHASAAAHAINSHDEIVENMQHYKQEAEQWESRATKEASRAQDLEAEVERLRGEVAYLNDRLEKHVEKMIGRLNK